MEWNYIWHASNVFITQKYTEARYNFHLCKLATSKINFWTNQAWTRIDRQCEIGQGSVCLQKDWGVSLHVFIRLGLAPKTNQDGCRYSSIKMDTGGSSFSPFIAAFAHDCCSCNYRYSFSRNLAICRARPDCDVFAIWDFLCLSHVFFEELVPVSISPAPPAPPELSHTRYFAYKTFISMMDHQQPCKNLRHDEPCCNVMPISN